MGFRYLSGIEGRFQSFTYRNWRGIIKPKSDGNVYELYDLQRDPDEVHNIFPGQDLKSMFGTLSKWMEPSSVSKAPESKMNKTDIENLKALGYL